MNTSNNRRIIGFTSTTANATTAPHIKNVTSNVLNCYSLKQWEVAFKKVWPRVKKLVKFYIKILRVCLILFIVGMAVTFGLTLVGEILPSLPEKMPQLFHFVEEVLIPYYERFFAICSKSISIAYPSL